MPIVSARGITRTFLQGSVEVKALRGVDLDIEKGEFTTLMGPSGSGKTTLLHILGGLDQPTTGSVTIGGENLAAMNNSQLTALRRDKIGFVFQSYNLIPVFTAAENAEFVMMLQGVPEKERRERAKQALVDVGLDGLFDRRPGALSGGQQQRVAIARGLAARPDLVIADEPTANLDSKTSYDLIDLMRRLNEDRGITFLFATHDPKIMEAARRVVNLVDGVLDSDEKK